VEAEGEEKEEEVEVDVVGVDSVPGLRLMNARWELSWWSARTTSIWSVCQQRKVALY